MSEDNKSTEIVKSVGAVSKSSKSPRKNFGGTKTKKPNIGLSVIMFIAIAFFVGSIIFLIFADQIGRDIGSSAGTAAGVLNGSIEGWTVGYSKGVKEGKEEGLSAKDTVVTIDEKVKTVGNLEVLSASVVMHDLNEIGDNYKSILALYFDAVFSVDLTKAEISIDGNTYNVILPNPTVKLVIDDDRTKKIASYMPSSWSGSNEDGYTAAKNSIKELESNARNTIANYTVLESNAKDSARSQVSFLIQSATSKEVIINVEFKENTSNE